MKKYIEERSGYQRKWYQIKADKNKKLFFEFQTWIIILGASIPILVVLEGLSDFIDKYGGLAAAIISATITVLAGLDKLYQPQPNWFNYRANEESIKKEEWFYKYKAGRYIDLNDEVANNLFIERIEGIISSDIARVSDISNDKSDDTVSEIDDTESMSDGNESDTE
jgi:hypothetical protein